MKELKKGISVQNEPDTQEEISELTEAPASVSLEDVSLDAEKADEILREYSAEDNERQLNRITGLIVNAFSLFISLFLIYTAAFGAFDALKQRSLYLLAAMVILFLVYPALSKSKKKTVPRQIFFLTIPRILLQ